MNKSFLKLARCVQLQKLGISSDSGFYWFKKDKKLYALKDIFSGVTGFEKLYVPAYTDADLIEILPAKIHIGKTKSLADVYDLSISKSTTGERYHAEYRNSVPGKTSLVQVYGPTEVDAKHDLILFLNRKKLIEIK